MLLRLALVFILVPLAELAILVWLGRHVGLVPTVALVVATGILGAALARHQGVATWRRFREALAAGRPPHRELVDGILVLLAGAVLLTPGLLTDLAGFALLVPPLRRRLGGWLAGVLAARFRVRVAAARGAGGGPAGGDAVDVDFRVVDDEPEPAGPGPPPHRLGGGDGG